MFTVAKQQLKFITAVIFAVLPTFSVTTALFSYRYLDTRVRGFNPA